MKFSVWRIVMLVFLVGAGLVGCAPHAAQSDEPYIDFSDVDPAIVEQTVQDETPLKIAVAAVISPEGTAESYRLLLEYLQERLQRPVELVQRRTYREINALLEEGRVDIAFVCTSAYVEGHDGFGMRLLVAPEVNGQTQYRSLLIVSAESDIRDVDDLRGKTFAFTDPISTTGRAYPTYLLRQRGYDLDTFLGRTFFTYSHDDAIRAVANGVADAAGVDSLVYAFALQREPELAHQVRVIHRSPPFGIPPVVVGPDAPAGWITALRDIFLNMNADPKGREALAALGVNRFVLIDDAAYDTVREIQSEAFSP